MQRPTAACICCCHRFLQVANKSLFPPSAVHVGINLLQEGTFYGCRIIQSSRPLGGQTALWTLETRRSHPASPSSGSGSRASRRDGGFARPQASQRWGREKKLDVQPTGPEVQHPCSPCPRRPTYGKNAYCEMTPNLSAQRRDSPMCVYFHPGTNVLDLQSARGPFPAFSADVPLAREFVLARVLQECQLAHATSFLRSADIPQGGGVCTVG